MDQPAFDHLTRAVAALRTRRATATALATGLAALPLLGGSALLPQDTAAKRKRHQQGAHAEKKKKKKKATYCLNGATTQVTLTKKSKKRLKKQGATPGACAPTGCATACPSSQRCCGAACVTGAWANQTLFGLGGFGSDQLNKPRGIALSADTLTAAIADTMNVRVSIWTRPSASSTAWAPFTTIGSPGSGPGGLAFPTGVAISPDAHTIWIADATNNRIAVWSDTSGIWMPLTTFGGLASGSASNRFNLPFDVAITADGLSAAIADFGNNRVSIWTRPANDPVTWTNQQVFGGAGSQPDKVQSPGGVAISADGRTVLVADTNNHRISVWTRPSSSTAFAAQTTFGSGSGSAPAQFASPSRVALASDMLTAYVADTGNDRVAIWSRPTASSSDWAPVTTIGSAGSAPEQLNDLRGVAISPSGQTLWIADVENSRISVWAMACPA
ncbi:MAG: hypothetical protein QM692_11860 [Thermomicrobiales bacterium]